jgi:DNA-binding transcriptional MerR regulator
MKTAKRLFSSQTFDALRACELAGLTSTMLNYLTREGFVVPSGSSKRGRGNKRYFTFGDLVTLRVISKLLRSGIEIKRLWRGLRALRKKVANSRPGQLPFRFVVTDGTDSFFESAGSLESLTRNGQLAFLFLIDLDRCDHDIGTKVKNLPAQPISSIRSKKVA